jgi:hypothetical protein
MPFVFLIVALTSISTSALAETQHKHGAHANPYAGQEDRAIKSLTDDDIRQLRAGQGWGLAKAAELNGVPGPAHLLELKDQIPLDENQVRQIQALFEKMQYDAARLGAALIKHEATLETHFSDGTITDPRLRATLADIAETRRELRYTHLAAHLETPRILSKHQIARYNSLRGYKGHGHAH